ncbi:unnamed protein product [Bursaphelenchus xylophilus]|uniref:(pine wood nematode) hypothetical protein n=1 Tax=Bursaphelenchus xylophilus TaxID=6326 RepID=A0A1I7RJ10_BURXY|nr:unnamed protein product [Bursaphelenchus xylophilus]CAG9119229.1 unnamed protein product [Bursaphelenchus xylophilus]
MCSRVALISFAVVCFFAYAYACGCGCDCCGGDSQCPPGLILNSTRRRRAAEGCNVKLTTLPRVRRQAADEKLAEIEGQTHDRDVTPQVSLIKAVNPMGLRRKPAAASSTASPVELTVTQASVVETTTSA